VCCLMKTRSFWTNFGSLSRVVVCMLSCRTKQLKQNSSRLGQMVEIICFSYGYVPWHLQFMLALLCLALEKQNCKDPNIV
jgi:hypothetical protein